MEGALELRADMRKEMTVAYYNTRISYNSLEDCKESHENPSLITAVALEEI
jgi:hypothetical protein